MSNENHEHGQFWLIKDGQSTDGVSTEYGCKTPRELPNHNIPLQTTEWKLPDQEGEMIQAVRYFSKTGEKFNE